jgi:uncharacterized oxidoreductase
MQMTNNTILITGGTSGIGRALAEAFHDRGNRVIITGRRASLLNEIEKQRPGLVGVQLDVNDSVSLGRVVEDIRARFPELNVLIANAGISHSEEMMGSSWDISIAQEIVETNIMGVLRIVAGFLPVLKARSNATVMATSSALAFVPRADFPAYCASKAFLHSWLQSLRHQLRTIPVEVLELSPPYVQTELTGEAQASDPRAMPLAQYVAEVMKMLEEKRDLNGELILDRDLLRRHAERDGRYQEMFSALNPV